MNDLLPKMTEYKINLKKLQNYKKNCMYEYLKKWINPTEERENKETGI